MKKHPKRLIAYVVALLLMLTLSPSSFATEITPRYVTSESETNNTATTADELTLGIAMTGQIGSSGDVDYFFFTVETGQVSVSLSAVSNSANYNYTIYELYNGSYYNLITTDYEFPTADNSSNKTYKLNLPAGTYYAKVFATDSSGNSYYNANNTYYLTVSWAANSAVIMQGDTVSASDCYAMYDRLGDNGYTPITLNGWTVNGTSFSGGSNSSIPYVTAEEFKAAKNYTVAYYSGHGTNNSVPKINAMSSSPINVASELGVTGTNWENACEWQKDDNIKVLILASCDQLDSDVLQYYARIMKASGIRAIAGYHMTAPSSCDTEIANLFIDYAEDGNSIWNAWKTANNNSTVGYQYWAVLLYQENSNQYYRLPGYSGNIYTAPTEDAALYRYASHLTSSEPVSTTATAAFTSETADLPLSFTVQTLSRSSSPAGVSEFSEPTNASISQIDTKSIANAQAAQRISAEELNSAQVLVSEVVSEQVDVDLGVLEDTATVIEKTYRYYETYNGVKIADSALVISVDASGVNTVVDNWKYLEPQAGATTMSRSVMVSEAQAAAAIQDHLGIDSNTEDFEVFHACLAYAPVSSSEYVLCHEIISSYGTFYVNVSTGAVISVY